MRGTEKQQAALTIARATKAAKAAAGGPPLTEAQMQQRERAFSIYRDMGRMRTLYRLEKVLKDEFPDIAAARPTIERWSKRHGWADRVKAFDRGVMMAAAPLPVPVKIEADKEFNQVDALLAAAQMALTKAMKANPVVTKASDVKTLVDAAANAMKLIETLQSREAGKGAEREVAVAIAKTLDQIEIARRRDVEAIVKAAAKAAADLSGQQIEPILQAASAAAGLVLSGSESQTTIAAKDDVVIEADEHASEQADSHVGGDQEDVAGERISQSVATTTVQFADVLAKFTGEKRCKFGSRSTR